MAYFVFRAWVEVERFLFHFQNKVMLFLYHFSRGLRETYDAGFTINTAVADKGYLSRNNYALIDSFYAEALIPFKSNTTGKPKGKGHVWRKMFNYFQLHQEEFMQRYFVRNNAETTFFMLKAKLGDSLKSKNFVAQKKTSCCAKSSRTM